MEAPVLPKRVYRFGLFQVDADRGKLLRQGVPVKLQEQPLQVLCLLLERPGEIVTRDELRQSLWPEGTYVEFDGSLNAALKRLRFALGDDADNPIFIETVPRRGYRFIAPVECQQPSEPPSVAIPPTRLESSVPTVGDDSSSVSRWRWWMLAGMAVLLILVGWRYAARRWPSPPAARIVIAVLPFSNEGAGPDFDYLRYAVANDLATDLTSVRSVTVRPFASTSRYGSQSADPAAVGKELHVTHVVVGGFLLDKRNLRVNLELVDVARNQAVWREEISVSPEELVALHDKLAMRTVKGILPAVNISNASAEEMPTPKNEHALDLFLHSLTIPLDPEPNQLAIKKLEESVSLDSGYAPAWGELGWRYYVDFHYGSGSEAAVAKSLRAYKRQSELDPNMPPVSTNIRVEQGDLNGAYDQAAEFLRRRPDSSMAHFGMSYVLRYAGLQDQAGKECDAALALDPGFNGFRSCANPFILLGDYAHAQRYISLDAGFGALMRMRIAIHTGKGTAALTESNTATQLGFRSMNRFQPFLRACVNHDPKVNFEADPVAERDAELLFQNAELLGWCGQGDAALRELRKAIKGGHCSYPAMDTDSLFDSIRQRPEFGELRQAAIQCQQDFVTHRQQVDAAAVRQ
ncbi:MAG: winged helix-turn-helix domain-containing protein [Candidatus Sulfotelmatobacter sp.]|jgi:DNA-binding winged helix-turn-helix (wHTH) protein/TolB-like protein